jgi:hypothetical protein
MTPVNTPAIGYGPNGLCVAPVTEFVSVNFNLNLRYADSPGGNCGKNAEYVSPSLLRVTVVAWPLILGANIAV